MHFIRMDYCNTWTFCGLFLLFDIACVLKGARMPHLKKTTIYSMNLIIVYNKSCKVKWPGLQKMFFQLTSFELRYVP